MPANLRIGPTGLTSPVNTGTSSSTVPQPPPPSAAATGNTPSSSNDPNNYAGVFAQMLNMMSNQNIVCLI